MSSILDYLDWRGDLTFAQDGFNSIDFLIFAQLVHAPLENLKIDYEDCTLSSLTKLVYPEEPPKQEGDLIHSRWELWQAAQRSRRFGEVQLIRFSAHFEPEMEKQFAAALFAWHGTAILAFRGTDSTVVGWKEDFNMGFQSPVPSQEEALSFLCSSAVRFGRYYLCGHSKGGNLAMYAAAMCPQEMREHILGVYNYDGPGMDETIRGSEGWKQLESKLHSFVPESSVVGMLMFYEEKYTIIDSDSISIMQHNPYHWHVLGTDFVTENDMTASSQFMDQTLHAFIKSCSVHQRQVLIDTLFSLMSVSGATKLRDVPHGLVTHLDEVLAKYKSVPAEDRQTVNQALRILVDSGSASAQNMFSGWVGKLMREGLKKLRSEEEPEAVGPGKTE